MAVFTLIHVAISLVAIVAGFAVLFGWIANQENRRTTEVFLFTTVLTSLTGYGFPATRITPGHIVGAISLVVLTVAIFARYFGHAYGGWRSTYVINGTIALYLNFFVLIVQSFQKIPVLKALAPTQSEWPFGVTQLTALAMFIVLGILATFRWRPNNRPIAIHA